MGVKRLKEAVKAVSAFVSGCVLSHSDSLDVGVVPFHNN
jgi:hypothetical protein